MPPPSPHVFWLFGLSGAGKSTLANHLTAQLRADGHSVLALDGDILRAGLCTGLGYSDGDRAENLRRAAEAAKLGLASGLDIVASFITPLESHRRLIANILGDHVSFIYVSAPLAVCRARDVKGLYAGAKTGKVAQMTGVTSGFEEPARRDLVVNTDGENVAASVRHLLNYATLKVGREG